MPALTPTQPTEPAFRLALAANFGSVQGWADSFAALAQVADRGPGQLRLNFQAHTGALVNQWLPRASPMAPKDEPILAIELDAPADHPDALAQAQARMTDIDWALAYQRYQHAVHAASDAQAAHLAASPDDLAGALVLDVRRAGVYEKAATVIPGARWCDPATVARWATDLPTDQAVVVYCVYGHEVGRATAMRLRAVGVNARYLPGGIDGWARAGHPVAAKPGTPGAAS